MPEFSWQETSGPAAAEPKFSANLAVWGCRERLGEAQVYQVYQVYLKREYLEYRTLDTFTKSSGFVFLACL